MNHWTMQEDGSVLGVATDRAVQWSGDDHERIAAVGFVGWLRDTGQTPLWYLSDWSRVSVLRELHGVESRPTTFTVLLDQSDDPDTFLVPDALRETWYAVVRVYHSSGNHMLHILGMTATLDQTQRRFNGPIPRDQLLSCREWLPTPEADAA